MPAGPDPFLAALRVGHSPQRSLVCVRVPARADASVHAAEPPAPSTLASSESALSNRGAGGGQPPTDGTVAPLAIVALLLISASTGFSNWQRDWLWRQDRTPTWPTDRTGACVVGIGALSFGWLAAGINRAAPATARMLIADGSWNSTPTRC